MSMVIRKDELARSVKKWMALTKLPEQPFLKAFNFTSNTEFDLADSRSVDRSNLDSFESQVGMSFESFLNEDVCPQLLRKRLLGDQQALPERYDFAKGSRTRSSWNILEYLVNNKGWKLTTNLLAKLNMQLSYFDRPDNKINFFFFLDLFQELENLKVDLQTLKNMAYYSVSKNAQTAMGKTFALAKSDRELYALLALYIENYDINFNYTVRVLKDKAILITSPNEKIMDELHLNKPGNRHICSYKQHVFSSLPMYRKRPALPLVEYSCMYQGSSVCTYAVTFTPDK